MSHLLPTYTNPQCMPPHNIIQLCILIIRKWKWIEQNMRKKKKRTRTQWINGRENFKFAFTAHFFSILFLALFIFSFVWYILHRVLELVCGFILIKLITWTSVRDSNFPFDKRRNSLCCWLSKKKIFFLESLSSTVHFIRGYKLNNFLPTKWVIKLQHLPSNSWMITK